MKYDKLINKIKKNKIISRKNLHNEYLKIYKGKNIRSFDNAIVYLKRNNIITEIAANEYSIVKKNIYKYNGNSEINKIYELIEKKYPKIRLTIWNTEILNEFLLNNKIKNYIIIEIEKTAIDLVTNYLKEKYINKYTIINQDVFNTNREEFFSTKKIIIIKPLIVRAPLEKVNKYKYPTIEKIMVDLYIDKLYIEYQGSELEIIYKEIFGNYDINIKKLFKYANERTNLEKYKNYIYKLNMSREYENILKYVDNKKINKYEIKKAEKDFIFTPEINNKGSRIKRTAVNNNGKKAIFKYQKYNCSEACSEKISYEIAKVIEYSCAKIELAVDEDNTLGILNYIFIDKKEEEHIDAISYIKKNNQERKDFYTLKNIKKCLDELNKDLFFQFLKIMIFDALVGEQDRHEENWGIIIESGHYKLSPLYDNGCNLLREFYNEEIAQKYYEGTKNFESFIERSKTLIYKEDGKKYKHFELIRELYNTYPEEIKREIINLGKLTDEKINIIVNKIPENIITDKHKEWIIKYLKIRKRKLLNIIKKESEKYEK